MINDERPAEIARNSQGISIEALLTGMRNRADVNELIKFLEKKTGRTIGELDPLKLSDEERRKQFGERLRMARHGARLKQVELAEEIGVSKGAVAAYEVGRSEPNLRNLIALSRVLGVPADWLLGESSLPQ